MIARGVQRATEDLDVAYARDRENLSRLASALAPIHPRLRGVPEGLPFVLDGLERAKRAAGRPKDLVDLGYIRALKG